MCNSHGMDANQDGCVSMRNMTPYRKARIKHYLVYRFAPMAANTIFLLSLGAALGAGPTVQWLLTELDKNFVCTNR